MQSWFIFGSACGFVAYAILLFDLAPRIRRLERRANDGEPEREGGK